MSAYKGLHVSSPRVDGSGCNHNAIPYPPRRPLQKSGHCSHLLLHGGQPYDNLLFPPRRLTLGNPSIRTALSWGEPVIWTPLFTTTPARPYSRTDRVKFLSYCTGTHLFCRVWLASLLPSQRHRWPFKQRPKHCGVLSSEKPH